MLTLKHQSTTSKELKYKFENFAWLASVYGYRRCVSEIGSYDESFRRSSTNISQLQAVLAPDKTMLSN